MTLKVALIGSDQFGEQVFTRLLEGDQSKVQVIAVSGSLATFSSEIPCTSVAPLGIGIPGFTSHVLLSLFPLGNTFKMHISTILSVAMLIPVVSKSKKQSGLCRVRFMLKVKKLNALRF